MRILVAIRFFSGIFKCNVIQCTAVNIFSLEFQQLHKVHGDQNLITSQVVVEMIFIQEWGPCT